MPLVQAVLALGMGAGPAAAQLLTLAPVIVPSPVMLGRSLPWRLLLTLSVGVAGFAAATGAVDVAVL